MLSIRSFLCSYHIIGIPGVGKGEGGRGLYFLK